MPSLRRVSFSERNQYSRLPHDDELYVIKAFARHADRCASCYDPYQAYRDGSTLCPRGHQRALDVAQYVYGKGSQAYSQVDKERNQRVQIEIPANCEAVRSLLKAMDRGLRIMRKHTPTSYDRSYYVPARLSVPDNHPSVPTTRPSTATAPSTSTSNTIRRSASTKSQQQAPLITPKSQSNSRTRARAISTSSISSDSSINANKSTSSSRGIRGAWVRSRSKDGKRSHSPIFVRPGSSNSRQTSAAPANLHSRNNSNSSSSSSNSRSSSIFSRSRSRNDSISSLEESQDDSPQPQPQPHIKSKSKSQQQQTQQQYQAPPPPPSKTLNGAKIAFRTPKYREEDFELIVPKNVPAQQRGMDQSDDLVDPVRTGRAYTRQAVR